IDLRLLQSWLLSLSFLWTNKNPPPVCFWRWVSTWFELFGLAQQVTSARRRVIRFALAVVVIRVFGIIEVMFMLSRKVNCRGRWTYVLALPMSDHLQRTD